MLELTAAWEARLLPPPRADAAAQAEPETCEKSQQAGEAAEEEARRAAEALAAARAEAALRLAAERGHKANLAGALLRVRRSSLFEAAMASVRAAERELRVELNADDVGALMAAERAVESTAGVGDARAEDGAATKRSGGGDEEAGEGEGDELEGGVGQQGGEERWRAKGEETTAMEAGVPSGTAKTTALTHKNAEVKAREVLPQAQPQPQSQPPSARLRLLVPGPPPAGLAQRLRRNPR
jgi:hypothetical protein